MSTIHFLNVGDGDCAIIEHNSHRVSMIDICGGHYKLTLPPFLKEAAYLEQKAANYRMCERPTNPISYLAQLGINSIFRFILTHPEMDHLDGFSRLTSIVNFWDSEVRRVKPDFGKGPYKEVDWDAYEAVISGSRNSIHIVTPKSGSRFKYANKNEDGSSGSDGLYILAPDSVLVQSAIESGNVNDASYVILYKSRAGNILFPGDAHDKTWEFVLEHHSDDVAGCKILFAPHHGRKSDRSYDFLDVVQPQLTIFGCAPSEHLAYGAWSYRKLKYLTQNQAGNIVFEIDQNIDVFVENVSFAIENGDNPANINPQGYYHFKTI